MVAKTGRCDYGKVRRVDGIMLWAAALLLDFGRRR
jgi:hypothetical protein